MSETPLPVFPEEETRNVTRNHALPRPQAGPPPWATTLRPPESSSWGHQTTRPPASRGPGLPPNPPSPLFIYFSVFTFPVNLFYF